MSESPSKRTRFAPSSSDPRAYVLERDTHALEAMPSALPARSLEAFFDEPTLEFDAAVLAAMLARSESDGQEETRTYQIPADVLAAARGDAPASAGRSAAGARAVAPLVAPLGHLLMTASAIALGYILVHLIDG